MRRLIFALVALVGSPVVHGAVLAAPGAMCGGMAATIVGTEGKDVIELTPGRDVVVALGGDDRVYNPRDTEKNESASDPQPVDAPENDDVVCLGDGDDFAKGAHRVDGGAGKDEIRRAEVVHAGPGDDSVINDGCRPAVVYLGAGNDRFVGFGSYDPSFEGPMGNSDYNQCRNANDEVHGGTATTTSSAATATAVSSEKPATTPGAGGWARPTAVRVGPGRTNSASARPERRRACLDPPQPPDAPFLPIPAAAQQPVSCRGLCVPSSTSSPPPTDRAPGRSPTNPGAA